MKKKIDKKEKKNRDFLTSLTKSRLKFILYDIKTLLPRHTKVRIISPSNIVILHDIKITAQTSSTKRTS